MSEQKHNAQAKEEAPKSIEGAVDSAAAAKRSAWKRLLSKKWVFPATYMAAAAIILTLMWVYQDSGKAPNTDQNHGLETGEVTNPADSTDETDALPVTVKTESMHWPVANRSELEVSKHFFDKDASNEARQSAVVEYNDTYMPHIGVDFSRQDNQPFDVLAAMSGTVTRVENLPLIGQLVEITHENGLKTIYHSLSEVKATKDAKVKQGDVIAKAGRNELEKDEGVHLHFEVHQEGKPVNPETLISEN